MGCDIHAFVEHCDSTKEKRYWWGFGDEFRLSRSYLMFAIMAGVRIYDITPIVKPRGVPKDSYFNVINKYTSYIVEDANYDSTDSSGEYTKKSDAEESFANGYAQWWDDAHSRIIRSDWHSASWLTTKEFEKCLQQYIMETDEDAVPPTDYRAILALMRFFESEGRDCRLVFWFDN